MDASLKRILLVLAAIASGVVAGFYLWSVDSQYTYAALIPAVGGILLALPAVSARAQADPRLGQGVGIAAWLALTVAIVLGAESPRPVAFFWLVGLVVGLFLLSALLHPNRAWHAAVGLAAVFVLVRWSSYHAYATFGGGDAFTHLRIVETVIVTEQVAPLHVAGKYVTAPGFHLAAATARLVTGLGRSDTLFWTVVVAQLALPLGVYAFARRWGPGIGPAAAIAVLATESSLVFAGLHPIPGGLTLVLVLGLLVGLYRRDAAGVLVFVLVGLAGILTHHLTIVVALLFVGIFAGWLAAGAFRGRAQRADFFPLILFLLLVLSFVVVHAVIAPTQGVTFFSKMFDNLSESAETATPGAGEDLTLAERRSVFSSFLYKATLVFGSSFVVAAGAHLMTERSRSDQATGIGALVVLVLAFALPFLGIDLVSDRWMPVVFAVGLLGMGALVFRWSKASQTGLVLGLVGFSLLGITQPAVVHDHDFYASERNVQLQFNEPDIVAVSLAGFSPRLHYTDVAMTQLFRIFGGIRAQQVLTTQADDTGRALPSVALIVLRVDLYEEGRLHFGLPVTEKFELVEPNEGFQRRLELTSRVSDTGSVRTYAT